MENGVMIQYFEWNLPNDGLLWKQIKEDAVHLREKGVTAVWIPPAYKAMKQEDVGYGTYDLYDLGEFDQKGTVRTKYGTKQELVDMVDELHKNGVSVYLDVVMNHKAGADHTEKCMAKLVNPDNRDEVQSEPFEIECWVGFDFPGRCDRYSAFKWHWYHFSGTDFNEADKSKGVYKIVGEGKDWSEGVDGENGNYDYLMFADIDFDHPEVIEEMKEWGRWVSRELNLDGMRLDAIKHINNQFVKHFLEAVRADRGEEFYAVGEYWKDDIDSLDEYLSTVEYRIDLFDVCLHYNMFLASQKKENYDLRNLFSGTLVECHPGQAVTFVDNHDSQRNSSLESVVKDWFKPIAYALILLSDKGYPCIFYGDYYSVAGKESPHRWIIDTLLTVRMKYAYGEQTDYFDYPYVVGFTRGGNDEHANSGLALLVSNGNDGNKLMNVGANHAGETWHEVTGNRAEEVVIDEEGNGRFFVSGCSLAVWVKK